jgi:hypothetical protein
MRGYSTSAKLPVALSGVEKYETVDKAYHEDNFETQSTMTEGFATSWTRSGGFGRR